MAVLNPNAQLVGYEWMPMPVHENISHKICHLRLLNKRHQLQKKYFQHSTGGMNMGAGVAAYAIKIQRQNQVFQSLGGAGPRCAAHPPQATAVGTPGAAGAADHLGATAAAVPVTQ